MIQKILFFSAALILAASSGVSAAVAQSWQSQAACEAATHRECVINSTKQWVLATAQATPKKSASPEAMAAPKSQAQKPLLEATPEAPKMPASQPKAVAVVPPTPPQASAQEGGGFFSRFFGGGDKARTPAVVAKDPEPKHVPDARPFRAESPRPAVDPEQLLRGKVWTSQSDCKNEALKGTCSSVDCATHTGGVCSGFTSMIWIYR